MAVAVYLHVSDNTGDSTLFLKTTTSNSSHQIPLILEYLNEGGANFIFVVKSPTENAVLPARLRQKLLRVRKDNNATLDTSGQLESLLHHFVPLFPTECLIQHDRIAFGTGVIASINADLTIAPRPAKRLRDRLPVNETHAVLVTDMRALQPGEIGVHFKPKWLVQSPDAPPNAVRCRTCALRAWRTSRGAKTSTDNQEICPLDLISNDVQARKMAAARLTNDVRLVSWLVNESHQLLRTLMQWQSRFGRSGFLAVDKDAAASPVQDLCKAMTLRDCTLYLLVRDSEATVEARLGDLDFKQPEKLVKWQGIEQNLIDGGWYTGSETLHGAPSDLVCSLSRR